MNHRAIVFRTAGVLVFPLIVVATLLAIAGNALKVFGELVVDDMIRLAKAGRLWAGLSMPPEFEDDQV